MLNRYVGSFGSHGSGKRFSFAKKFNISYCYIFGELFLFHNNSMTIWSKQMLLETVGWIIGGVNNISRCEIAKRNH